MVLAHVPGEPGLGAVLAGPAGAEGQPSQEHPQAQGRHGDRGQGRRPEGAPPLTGRRPALAHGPPAAVRRRHDPATRSSVVPPVQAAPGSGVCGPCL
ncbi:hypothetical protein [Ornithinimicrobium kibberense]|uniref:hypothetical protein n=1 Tax=Ornithinimicrobium kibberense TaxID=282060 RepID=UPI003609C387